MICKSSVCVYLDTALNHLILDMEIFLIFWSVYLMKAKLPSCVPWRDVESEDTVPVILNLGTRWGWEVSFISHHLPVGKLPWFPLVGVWVVQRVNPDILNMRRISYHCWELHHDSWNRDQIVEILCEVCCLSFQFFWRYENSGSTIQCSVPTLHHLHREFRFSHFYIISYTQASNANPYHPFTSLIGELQTSQFCRRY